MTTVLHPPQLGPAQSPYPPPPSTAVGPSRAVIAAALLSLIASLASVTVVGISWASPHSGSTHSAPTSAVSRPDAGQVAAARTKACQLWSRSANVMDEASTAVARAPKDWNAPETQQALTDEARIVLVESAYLRHHLPAETPSEVRAGIDEYLAASIDMENATAHRQGKTRDAAIDRANEAESKVTAACK